MPMTLERKLGQYLRVGDAEVHVKHISKGNVKLLIVAPPETRIWRGELWEKILATEEAKDDNAAS